MTTPQFTLARFLTALSAPLILLLHPNIAVAVCPTAPPNLTGHSDCTWVGLSWGQTTALSYNILRRINTVDPDWVGIQTVQAPSVTASILITPAMSGQYVDFRVDAIAGPCVVQSSTVGLWVQPAVFAQGVTATALNNGYDDGLIKVSWTPQQVNNCYADIYRDNETQPFATADLSSGSHTFVETVCGGAHRYSIQARNGTCQSAKSAQTASVIAVVPQQTDVAAINQGCDVLLDWYNVAGETGYNIYRGVNLTSRILVHQASQDESTWIDINPPNITLVYWVVPFNCSGNARENGDVRYPEILPEPTGVTATDCTANKIYVSWNPVANAQGYVVFRDGVLIANVVPDQTVFIDVPPDAEQHQYCVGAVQSCGNGPTSCDSGCRLLAPPAPPPGPTAAWSTLGISARMDAAMLYDPDADRFVVFGGDEFQSYFDDALQLFPGYYNDAWQPIYVSSTLERPAERSGHTIIYDRAQRRLILFGGKDRTGYYFNDVWALPLWTLDGNGVWQPWYGSWQRLVPGGAAVPGLTDHTAVLDILGNRMLVYGGKTQSNLISDQLYALDLQTPTWSVLNISSAGITGPFGRHKHVAIYALDDNSMYLFGGEQYHNASTTLASPTLWRLRLYQPTLQWELFLPQVGSSPAGVNGGAVYDAARSEMVLYGGNVPGSPAGSSVYRVPLEFPNGYQVAPLTMSLRRESFAYAYDSLRSRMWMFGGTEGKPSLIVGPMPRNDTWSLALGTNPQWISTHVRPYAGTWVRNMSLVYDDQHARTIMFGGDNGVYGSSSATLVLGLAGYPDQWAIPNLTGGPPNHRYDHCAIYDRWGDRMIIHGGRNEGGDLSDLWALKRTGGQDLSSNDYQWVPLPNTGGPGPLSGHSAVFADISPTNRKMIIFGGRSNGTLQSKVWSYDLIANTWQLLSTTGSPKPTARADHAAVYDYPNKKMFIFYGRNLDGVTDEVYFLDLITNVWAKGQFTGARPLPRSNMTVVLSPYSDARAIMFGGDSDGILRSDTWSVRVWDIPSTSQNPPSPVSWSQLPTRGTTTPGERQGHAAVYTGVGHMMMFGGVWQNPSPTLDEHYNDTWDMYYDAGMFASLRARPAGDPDSPLVESSIARKLALDIERISRSQVRMRLALDGAASPSGENYQLSVYDVAGRIRRHFHPDEIANRVEIVWDMTDDHGRRLAAGIYFIRLKSQNSSVTQRVVVLH